MRDIRRCILVGAPLVAFLDVLVYYWLIPPDNMHIATHHYKTPPYTAYLGGI